MRCECVGQKCRMEANDSRHGTANGYTNQYCRCQPCRDAHCFYIKLRVDAWRQKNIANGLTAHGKERKIGRYTGRIRSKSDRRNDGYATDEVIALTGFTYRQIDFACRNNWVRPSLAESNGSGSYRRWSEEDLELVKMAYQFIEDGYRTQIAWKKASKMEVSA